MGTDSRHLAFVQHYNAVGMADRADPLCNDQDCRILRFLRQRFSQRRIRLEVQCGKAVVKDIKLRLFHQGAGDGKPLLLSAGKIRTALGDKGLKPIGQGADKFSRLCHLRGMHQLLFGSILSAVAEVGLDGS